MLPEDIAAMVSVARALRQALREPLAALSDEDRVAIERSLEVEHADLQRVRSDGQARIQSPGT
jgi:hypothetical protein